MSASNKQKTNKEYTGNNHKKNKATSGGGKDVNDGGRPASEIKRGKGETTGSKGSKA